MGNRLVESVMGAVVLAIAALFLVFAWNTADIRAGDGTSYSAQFNSVGGLAPGNDVRIGGVKVGSVTAQEIDPKTYRAVVSFTVRTDLRVPKDTEASIASDGLLGGTYLRLKIGRSRDMLGARSTLSKTRDALSLEDLLGRAIFLLTESDKKSQ